MYERPTPPFKMRKYLFRRKEMCVKVQKVINCEMNFDQNLILIEHCDNKFGKVVCIWSLQLQKLISLKFHHC